MVCTYYIVSYVHVYTMYRHGIYMFMTLRTTLTIHKHVHTTFRHVHTRLEDLLFVCQCLYMYRTCYIHVVVVMYGHFIQCTY